MADRHYFGRGITPDYLFGLFGIIGRCDYAVYYSRLFGNTTVLFSVMVF